MGQRESCAKNTPNLTPKVSLELTLIPGIPGPGNTMGESDTNADTWERTLPHREREQMVTHQMFPPPELKGKLQRFVITICPNPELHRNVLIGGNCSNTTVKCRKFNTHWSGDAEGKGLAGALTHSHCRHTSRSCQPLELGGIEAGALAAAAWAPQK